MFPLTVKYQIQVPLSHQGATSQAAFLSCSQMEPAHRL